MQFCSNVSACVHISLSCILKYICLVQAVSKQLEKAQQDLSSASSEEGKAEANIAIECAEALLKALQK